MLNSTQIIEQIQNDAPCVYNILHEELYPDLDPCPQDGGMGYTWDDYFTEHPEVTRPTADQLLGVLTEYDGDNWDVHYWLGRYAQMIETAEAIDSMIKVFEDNREKLAPMMDYEYTIKIDLLKNLQENII